MSVTVFEISISWKEGRGSLVEILERLDRWAEKTVRGQWWQLTRPRSS
ncbi:hypothetical protein [Pyrobaculum aerophilum]|nr:hypothetical protein [Pyrobaculum aerophilum]